MLEPARVVSDAFGSSVEIEIVHDDEEDGAIVVNLHGRLGEERVVGVENPECDVVVFQRPADRRLVEAIPFIQAYGTAVVCDYDDDFDTIPTKNSAWRAYEPRFSPGSNKVWAKLGSHLADLTTVTTPSLARSYGRPGCVVELPNCVPERYLKIDKTPNDLPVVGWAGNPRTHPDDLEMMGNVIPSLVRGHDAVFQTIGHEATFRRVGFEFASGPNIELVKWAPIDEFPFLVAGFDVGLAPLHDSRFNRAKSWLKGLEYAALGVPFVASPVHSYQQLAALGAGDLVRTTTPNARAWREAIELLLEHDDYRARRAAQGRAAASAWTYEQQAERWLIAWRNALTLRRAT